MQKKIEGKKIKKVRIMQKQKDIYLLKMNKKNIPIRIQLVLKLDSNLL